MPTPVDSERPLRIGACLSLTGRFARFGSQAAAALETWKLIDGHCELILEDDESTPRTLERVLPRLARNCDILLGPYSTQLVRTAGKIATPTPGTSWPLLAVLTPLATLPTSPRRARADIRDALTAWDMSDLVEAAELVGTELVTNAVRASERLDTSACHPGMRGGVIGVRLLASRTRLRIEVWDQAAGFPSCARHPPTPSAAGVWHSSTP